MTVSVLAAQRAFLEAETRSAAMVRTHPRPTDVAAAAARAHNTAEPHAEFARVMEEQRSLAEQLEDYWASVEPEKRAEGRAGLQAAARAQMADC